MKYYIYLFFLLSNMLVLQAQETKKVLFLGNSYTYVNNLPNLVSEMAISTNDVLRFDSNTPGGYTLEGHAQNTTSLTKIKRGDWDYVILQDQSQRPSFPDAQVGQQVYPYAQRLNDSIIKYNNCAKTTFYMTWGRENGDANNCPNWPPVCTYEGMDDLLSQRYITMANDNDGYVSPVGAVWRSLRNNYPALDLYSSDGSHPSLTGSYTAALTFYTIFYRKDPTLVTFHSTLNQADAQNIKNTVKTIVFDELINWNVGLYDPNASFNYSVNNGTIDFTNESLHSTEYEWDFGDGNTSEDENPSHVYDVDGMYIVSLTVTDCNKTSEYTLEVNTTLSNNQETVSNVSINTLIENDLIVQLENRLNVDLIIFDMTGRIVHNQLDLTDNNINLSKLTNGIYSVILKTNGKVILNKKIIKQ